MKKMLKKLLIGSNEDIAKKNFIWNMIGSTVFAFASVLLLMAATRTVGDVEGGVFSIAFTTGQMMLTIGYYEMRPFQVTDGKNKFSFQDYFTVRLITSVIMMICSFLFVFINGYNSYKAIIVILMCLYKMADGLADVFEGLFQKRGRLDIAGRSLAYRTIITTIIFIVTIIVTKDLFVTSIITVISAFIVLFIFDVAIIDEFEELRVSKNIKSIQRLLYECFPYFLGSFMSIYITNAVKYAIDSSMAQEFQTYFSIIFMPASTISLFSGFILKPLLTTLTDSWKVRDSKTFKNIIVKIQLAIIGFTIVCIVGGWLLGIPILSWLYRVDLSDYKIDLVILLLAGGIGAASTTFYYSLTVMRKTKYIFSGYLVTFLIALTLAKPFVTMWGFTGAAVFYCILMAVMGSSFAIFAAINYKKHKNDKVEATCA